MIKVPRHWLDCEIPASLERVLDSEEPVELDEVAIERMSMRLQESLGARFDARPTELLVSSPVWRAVLTGVGALAAIGVTWWLASSHAALQSASDAQQLGSTSAPHRAMAASNAPRSGPLQAAAAGSAVAGGVANAPRSQRTGPLLPVTPASTDQRGGTSNLGSRRIEPVETASQPSTILRDDAGFLRSQCSERLSAAASASIVPQGAANDPCSQRTELSATGHRGAARSQRSEPVHDASSASRAPRRAEKSLHMQRTAPTGAAPVGLPQDVADAASAPVPRAEREHTPAAESGKVFEPSAAPGLAEELQGLAQIRKLLARSPERALAAADEQLLRFARGVLGPERELLRLDALVRLGRRAQAQVRTAQLQAAPENHPYRARIADLLER